MFDSPRRCINCGKVFELRDESQCWCPSCSPMFGPKGPKKVRARERGLVINHMTRKGSLWLADTPESEPLWYVQIDLPWEAALYSKNRMLEPRFYGKRIGVGKSAASKVGRANIREAMKAAIEESGRTIFQCRTWIDILVERDTHNGDAQNVLDSVADAIQEAIGVDDKWYGVRRIDWAIAKINPRMYIGLGQTSLEDMFVCSSCGRELPVLSCVYGVTGKDSQDCRECANAIV